MTVTLVCFAVLAIVAALHAWDKTVENRSLTAENKWLRTIAEYEPGVSDD